MTGIVKTDQLQGAQGTTVTVPTGHTLAVTSNATVGGTLGVTSNTTVGGTLGVTGTLTSNGVSNLIGSATQGTDAGDTRFILTGPNQYRAVFKQGGNIAGQLGGAGSDVLRFSNAAGATIMEMNAGRITKPLTPFVRLQLTSHLSANTTVSSPGNQITGFTVKENVGSYWNSSNNNFTCPVAGVYSVSIFYIKYPGNGHAHVDLHKNGSQVDEVRWRAPEVSAGYHQVGGTASVTCAANDVLDWHYFGTAGVHDGNGSWEIMLSH